MKKLIFSLFAFLSVTSLCFAQQAQSPVSKSTISQTVQTSAVTKTLASKVDKEDRVAKIKLFQDSAIALQKSNPDLAKGLSDYADKEAKEIQDWKAKHDAKVKLLQDASAALQQSNPDLANKLQEMCKSKPNNEMQYMMQEKNEKEEAGEEVEPKGDK